MPCDKCGADSNYGFVLGVGNICKRCYDEEVKKRNKITDFLRSLTAEEFKELIKIINIVTDPLSQELMKKAVE